MNEHLEELGLEPLVGSDVALSLAGWKSPTTLLTAISDGKFPEPDRVIGRIRKWKPSTLRSWQANKSDAAT
jgi:hypothetical protein